jgi:O-antigen/teichoic acid export membrane protein
VVIVQRGGLLSDVVLGMLIVNAIILAGKMAYVRRRLETQYRIWERPNRTTLRLVAGFGAFSWLQSIASFVSGQLDRFLVAGMLGTAALGYYSVCVQLAQQIHAIPSRAIALLFPMVTAMHEARAGERLRKYYDLAYAVTCSVACMIGFPVFLFAPAILDIWLGPSAAADAGSILRILAFAYTVLATSIVPFYYMNGTGFVRLNSYAAAGSAALVGLATSALIPVMGLTGAAWARLASVPVSLVSRNILHVRVLDDRRWYAATLYLLPVLIPFGIAVTLLAPVDRLRPGLLALGAATVGASLVVGAIVGGTLMGILVAKTVPVPRDT